MDIIIIFLQELIFLVKNQNAIKYYFYTINRKIMKEHETVPHYVSYDAFISLCRMVKIYNRLHRSIGTLYYFTTHSWEWTYNNLDMLTSQLSPEDKKVR